MYQYFKIFKLIKRLYYAVKRAGKKTLLLLVIIILIGLSLGTDKNKITDTINSTKEKVLNISIPKTTESASNIIDKEKKSEYVKCNLIRVVDGDTIIVNYNGEEKSVRLIGMDTPESVNPDNSKNTEYGKLASEFTKNLMTDLDSVYLEFDVSATDKYNRLLAYVWKNEPVSSEQSMDIDFIKNNMLNAVLVNQGYAINKVYKPNVKYASVFENIRNEAEKNKTGLWSDDGFVKLW